MSTPPRHGLQGDPGLDRTVGRTASSAIGQLALSEAIAAAGRASRQCASVLGYSVAATPAQEQEVALFAAEFGRHFADLFAQGFGVAPPGTVEQAQQPPQQHPSLASQPQPEAGASPSQPRARTLTSGSKLLLGRRRARGKLRAQASAAVEAVAARNGAAADAAASPPASPPTSSGIGRVRSFLGRKKSTRRQTVSGGEDPETSPRPRHGLDKRRSAPQLLERQAAPAASQSFAVQWRPRVEIKWAKARVEVCEAMLKVYEPPKAAQPSFGIMFASIGDTRAFTGPDGVVVPRTVEVVTAKGATLHFKCQSDCDYESCLSTVKAACETAARTVTLAEHVPPPVAPRPIEPPSSPAELAKEVETLRGRLAARPTADAHRTLVAQYTDTQLVLEAVRKQFLDLKAEHEGLIEQYQALANMVSQRAAPSLRLDLGLSETDVDAVGVRPASRLEEEEAEDIFVSADESQAASTSREHASSSTSSSPSWARRRRRLRRSMSLGTPTPAWVAERRGAFGHPESLCGSTRSRSQDDLRSIGAQADEEPDDDSPYRVPSVGEGVEPQATGTSLHAILHQFSWYHGRLSRDDAVELLAGGTEGGRYLLRLSTSVDNQLVLSVNWFGNTKHFRVSLANNVCRISNMTFPSIFEMLNHFHSHPFPFAHNGDVPLMLSRYVSNNPEERRNEAQHRQLLPEPPAAAEQPQPPASNVYLLT